MKIIFLTALALAMLAGRAAAQSAGDLAHIAAIENGLLPAVVIEGRPLPRQTLAARMRATRTPGVSIAFFENGRIVWTRAYGVADVESGRRVTSDTLFQAASISKMLTATATLRLVQAGKLDLDQDVNASLQGWQVPASAFTASRKVTLRALLSHTAGLTVHGFEGYDPGVPLPSVIQILNGKPPANSPAVVSNAAPGAHWDYSGGGYVIVQLELTQATGEAFPRLMSELVLKPAHMTRSTFDQPLPAARKDEAASGYGPGGRRFPGGGRVFPEMAPAGLWTTPSDLARFAIALQNAYAGAPGAILSQEMARMMMTRSLGHWGLGVNLGPPGGPMRFSHAGGNPGFVSDVMAFTGDARQGVAIMTNSSNEAVMGELLHAVARAYGWSVMGPREMAAVQLSPGDLAALVGVYQGPDGDTVTVTVRDGRLYALAPGDLAPEEVELAPKSATEFAAVSDDTAIVFTKGLDGDASKLTIDDVTLTRTAGMAPVTPTQPSWPG